MGAPQQSEGGQDGTKYPERSYSILNYLISITAAFASQN